MIPIARPMMDEKEKEKVIDVINSGMLAAGEYVHKFEKEFCSYLGIEYAVATCNGTAALHAALKAAGIEKGDRVLTTPFTFIASTNAILYCDAIPVFADIDPDSCNLDPDSVEKKLKEDPTIKALLVVHLYGQTCDMEKICQLAEEYDLILIEDCAQAHGAKFSGKPAGTFGDVAVFSFYPTKNITTSEGGMIVSNRKDIYENCRLLINHGSSGQYRHQILGYNYRMTNIEAAIGLAQLEKLDDFNKQRQKNATYFNTFLKDLDWLLIPEPSEEYLHVFHLYTVKVNEREAFAAHLEKKGIGYGVYYPLPIYRQPLYKKRGFGEIRLTICEQIIERVISLPVHPALSLQERDQIVHAILSFKDTGGYLETARETYL